MEILRNIAFSLIATGLLFAVTMQLYENLKITAEADAEQSFKARIKRAVAKTTPPTVKIEVKGNWEQLQSGLYTHELKSDIDDLL